jgi:hypothetical protein
MGFIESIVDGFIVIMGITPPRPEKKRIATVFIGTGLIATVVAIVSMLAFLISRLIRH